MNKSIWNKKKTKRRLQLQKDKKLSWEETCRETAEEQEDWSDFDTTTLDGLEKNESNTAT